MDCILAVSVILSCMETPGSDKGKQEGACCPCTPAQRQRHPGGERHRSRRALGMPPLHLRGRSRPIRERIFARVGSRRLLRQSGRQGRRPGPEHFALLSLTPHPWRPVWTPRARPPLPEHLHSRPPRQGTPTRGTLPDTQDYPARAARWAGDAVALFTRSAQC